MYDHRELVAFLAICDTGSVTAAAAKLFLTQPTVSRRVTALEHTVGVPLFRRTPQGMTLTPAGTRLQPLAKDLSIRAQRAENTMAEFAGRDHQFIVACPETTGNGFIAPFMAQGGPILDVRPTLPADVYDQLGKGVDIAVNTAEPPKGFAKRALGSLAIHCMVPPEHAFAQRSTVLLREVKDNPCVMPGAGSAVSRTLQQIAATEGFSFDAELTSNGTLAQARTAAGAGPSLVVEEAMFGLTSIPVVHSGSPVRVTFYAAWDPTHYATAAIDAATEELRKFFRLRIQQLKLA